MTTLSSHEAYLEDLKPGFLQLFGGSALIYWTSFAELAASVLGAIARSDAPYHTVEHTEQVMVVGQALLIGHQLYCQASSPADWLNMMVALLCHDFGYVRGLCPEDDLKAQRYSGGTGSVVTVYGKTDACLAPYHVDRSQQFVRQNLQAFPLIDLEAVLTNIELTRFPVPEGSRYQDTLSYAGLCRAADLVGQMSDPRYLKKLPALYSEFEETGMNRMLGYRSAAELRANYPHFYWSVVFPYISDSLRYLAATATGRQIIARLYTNVYLVELEQMHRRSQLPQAGSAPESDSEPEPAPSFAPLEQLWPANQLTQLGLGLG
jgi:hypothetical protein